MLISPTQGEPSDEIFRVKSTLARMRSSPQKNARVISQLPIGAEVQKIKKVGTFFKVKDLRGKSGYISASLLQKEPLPSFTQYEKKIALLGAKSIKIKKQLIERMVAQFPLSLSAIETYGAFLEANIDAAQMQKALARKRGYTGADFNKSGPARLYFLRKGWVAAKRRSISPNGPLYPIEEGYALLPLPCSNGAEANKGRAPKDIPNLELRERATKIASSGKVVSVSEGGYKTQKLDTPLCRKDRLAYKMKKAEGGALVPSWLVAGYKVTPFINEGEGIFKATSAHAKARVHQGILEIGNFSTIQKIPLDPSIKPVALLSLSPNRAEILYRAPHDDVCDQATLYIERYDFIKRERKEGDRYNAALGTRCPTTKFMPLEGEPRDIGLQNMLSSDWQR